MPAGMYNFTPQDTTAAAKALQEEYDKLSYKVSGGKKWYRTYRNWAEFWRDTTQSALYGLGKTGPTDPLAQLQNQLMAQYQKQANAGQANFATNYDFGSMINARNQGMSQVLNQREAGMGVQGAYQGTMDAATQARQTLINQAMAQYSPMQYQASQQVQSNTDQLLTAISQADYEGRLGIMGAGRGV